MDYKVRFVFNYNVEAKNEVDAAMLVADKIFNSDTYLKYDIEVEPINNINIKERKKQHGR